METPRQIRFTKGISFGHGDRLEMVSYKDGTFEIHVTVAHKTNMTYTETTPEKAKDKYQINRDWLCNKHNLRGF